MALIRVFGQKSPSTRSSVNERKQRMKSRRLVCLIAVIVALVCIHPPASADEGKMNVLQTSLSSTTISGYVDTSIEWGVNRQTLVQPTPKPIPNQFARWWIGFRMWLRSHDWGW